MMSVTCAESVARVSRSWTRVFAEVGFRESTRGRRDLRMSMPVSPKRRAAKVMLGKKIRLDATTVQRGTQGGM